MRAVLYSLLLAPQICPFVLLLPASQPITGTGSLINTPLLLVLSPLLFFSLAIPPTAVFMFLFMCVCVCARARTHALLLGANTKLFSLRSAYNYILASIDIISL